MPGKMDYFVYTSNAGTQYSVKIREYYGTLLAQDGIALALGFGAQDLSKPTLPRGMKMRGIYAQDPTGGATRRIPVGATTAPVWDGTDTVVDLDYSGIGTTEAFNIIGKSEETPEEVAHAVKNLSDAA